jgi:hypothetical protein
MASPLLPALAAGALVALLTQIPASLNAAQRLLPVVWRPGDPEGLGSLSHRAPRHAPPAVLPRRYVRGVAVQAVVARSSAPSALSGPAQAGGLPSPARRSPAAQRSVEHLALAEQQARQRNPSRWSRAVRCWRQPDVVKINEPPDVTTAEEALRCMYVSCIGADRRHLSRKSPHRCWRQPEKCFFNKPPEDQDFMQELQSDKYSRKHSRGVGTFPKTSADPCKTLQHPVTLTKVNKNDKQRPTRVLPCFRPSSHEALPSFKPQPRGRAFSYSTISIEGTLRMKTNLYALKSSLGEILPFQGAGMIMQ